MWETESSDGALATLGRRSPAGASTAFRYHLPREVELPPRSGHGGAEVPGRRLHRSRQSAGTPRPYQGEAAAMIASPWNGKTLTILLMIVTVAAPLAQTLTTLKLALTRRKEGLSIPGTHRQAIGAFSARR